MSNEKQKVDELLGILWRQDAIDEEARSAVRELYKKFVKAEDRIAVAKSDAVKAFLELCDVEVSTINGTLLNAYDLDEKERRVLLKVRDFITLSASFWRDAEGLAKRYSAEIDEEHSLKM